MTKKKSKNSICFAYYDVEINNINILTWIAKFCYKKLYVNFLVKWNPVYYGNPHKCIVIEFFP